MVLGKKDDDIRRFLMEGLDYFDTLSDEKLAEVWWKVASVRRARHLLHEKKRRLSTGNTAAPVDDTIEEKTDYFEFSADFKKDESWENRMFRIFRKGQKLMRWTVRTGKAAGVVNALVRGERDTYGAGGDAKYVV